MQIPDDPAVALASRLRDLRLNRWPGRRITQPQLAAALGVSPPLVSGWESRVRHMPMPPPVERLDAYAIFFATERSIDSEPFRLLDIDQLSDEERDRYETLLVELTEIREAVLNESSSNESCTERESLLHFPDRFDITIVCAELPTALRTMSYADPDSPDFGWLYTIADPDVLLELFGHVRALNPRNQVNIRPSIDMRPDDYTTHLILLGGVDWNVVTRDLLSRVDIPVQQAGRCDSNECGKFAAEVGGARIEFEPRMGDINGRQMLIEDVAHIYRGTNPYNSLCTVTMFNGLYARGTFGAVRALVDPKFRDRNEAYLRERFAGPGRFSIITRVVVVNGEVVTPDWSVPEYLLYEWPED